MGKQSTEKQSKSSGRELTFRPSVKSRRGDIFAVLTIIVIWVAIVIVADPRGQFPLNDDWCYARAVRTLLHEHTLELLPVVAVPLVAQVLWGALFCLPFGFSFFALRISTLTLGLAGLIAVYALLREVRAPRWAAFVGSLTVAFNAIYLQLSNTFMTDVPFFAFAVLSVYLFVRGLRRDSTACVVGGIVLACAAALIRQLGVVLPVSFAAGYLVKNGLSPRSLAKALLPVVIVLGTLLIYQKWLDSTGRLPLYYSRQAPAAASFLTGDVDKIIFGAADVARTAFVYLGLFLLPFSILVSWRRWVSLSRLQHVLNWAAAAILFVVITATLISEGKWMPLCGNCINDYGMGPATFSDISILFLPHLPTVPRWLCIGVTVIGAAGAALVFRHILAAIEGLAKGKAAAGSDKAVLTMMLVASALFLAVVAPLAEYVYFDRYFLMYIPLLMAVAVLTANLPVRISRVGASLAVLVLLLYGFLAVAGVHDYLSWNRARWQALNDLMRQGVKSDLIDGGYELLWHKYRKSPGGDWEYAHDNAYVTTFGEMPGYREIKRYPFRRWIPPGQGSILVLHWENYYP